jgi:hypothetical protein
MVLPLIAMVAASGIVGNIGGGRGYPDIFGFVVIQVALVAVFFLVIRVLAVVISIPCAVLLSGCTVHRLLASLSGCSRRGECASRGMM